MKLIWTKSKLPLSWAIRTLTGDDCSHFAIHFESLGLVLQSNLIGVHLNTAEDFLNSAQIVHTRDVPLTKERESEICLTMMSAIAGFSYSIKGLLYFTWRELLLKLFGEVLPKENTWTNARQFLCTGIYDSIPDDAIPTFPKLEETAMVTPHMLFEEISKSLPKWHNF